MYPCGVCEEECLDDTIQCSECEKWTHRTCVPMEPEILNAWADANLKFLCKECCYEDGQFQQTKSLQRLESVIGGNPRDVRVVARSEALLLKTYGADIPNPVGDEVNGEVDSVSVDILKKFQPVVLEDVYPVRVAADGNCLYRAISKVICGNEALFILLRIFTLLEILSYPMFYDCDHKRFVDLISDNRIVVSTYIQLAKDVGKMGAYADMMHMYALSAVLKVPIRSYYPPQLAAEFVSQPHSRKICGRGVNVSGIPLCTVMWTQCVKLVGSAFVPNHFVPLLKKKTENEPDVFVVDLEEHHNEQPLSDIDDASDDGSITNFIDTTDDVHPLSNGCLSKQFLEIEYVIDLLTTYKYSESHNKTPEGTKSDVFFMVKNDRNLVSRDKGQCSTFSDDCGIWDSSKGSSPRTYFMTLRDGKLKTVYKKGDKFCDTKKVKGKKTFTPIESQPENVIELVRNYSVLKKDATYRRCVSWLGIGARESIALVEYFGKFPGLSQHGNGKEGTEYIRTPASVMTEMSDMLKRENPLKVYNKLVLKHDELSGPSSRKQVHDKKYNDKKKERKDEIGHYLSRANIADHINEIDKMLADGGSIVKSIIRDQGKAPCLILYSEKQLEDLRSMCCTGQSILGIDKTFNLCDMHVTASCYKQTSVKMETTDEPPIFLGPIFIHDNSDFHIFTHFFHHLKIKLFGASTNQLTIGSDEEKALVNAIKSTFPEAGHFLCMRHLRQNVKQQLIDDCIDKNDRESLLEEIFGDEGLINADDIVCFEIKCSEIEERAKALSSKFHRYFDNKLKQNLTNQWNEGVQRGHFDKGWTNNNSESLNHVLKRAINWQSEPLLDLVNTLNEIIDTQFKDLLRALVDRGQYRVADSHTQFRVAKTTWTNKTQEERQRYFRRFRNFVPKDKLTATSTDGKMTVIKPRSHGRKIGQRKRKINERSTTIKKQKTFSDDSE